MTPNRVSASEGLAMMAELRELDRLKAESMRAIQAVLIEAIKRAIY